MTFRLVYKPEAAALQCVTIPAENSPLLPDALVKHQKLPSSDPGANVTEAVVITYLGMLVMRSGIAGLGGQEPGFLNPFLVVGYQCPTSRGSNYLVSIERIDSKITK